MKSTRMKIEFVQNLENLKLFFSIFKFDTEEENNTFLAVFIKMVDSSKWPQI